MGPMTRYGAYGLTECHRRRSRGRVHNTRLAQTQSRDTGAVCGKHTTPAQTHKERETTHTHTHTHTHTQIHTHTHTHTHTDAHTHKHTHTFPLIPCTSTTSIVSHIKMSFADADPGAADRNR